MEIKIKGTTPEALAAWVKAQPKPVFCEHCQRLLTDPKSREAGIGPICKARTERGEGE